MSYTCTSFLFDLTQVESVHVFIKKHERHSYLPWLEARCTQQMTTGLNTNVLVILCTDFTQLECGTHFTVQFVLFLRHLDMVFWSWLHSPWEVRIYVAPVREQVAVDVTNIKTKFKKKKNFLPKWSFVIFVIIGTDGPQIISCFRLVVQAMPPHAKQAQSRRRGIALPYLTIALEGISFNGQSASKIFF